MNTGTSKTGSLINPPHDVDTILALADFHNAYNETENTVHLLELARAIAPLSDRSLLLLGSCYGRLGMKDSLSDLIEVDLTSTSGTAVNRLLAVVEHLRGNTLQAIAWFRATLIRRTLP